MHWQTHTSASSMAQRFDSILWLFVVATILMGFLELISHSILAFAYLMSAGLV